MANTKRFTDPATARAYIKSLAMYFEDPSDLLGFLGLCDIAQAALVSSLIEEIAGCHNDKTYKFDTCKIKNELLPEKINNYGECRTVFEELEIVKEKLRILISKLEVS